jgi:gamma-glutamylputrescine oxidase
MLSYWEKESFITYDFIIIGGGIVGLSTAVSLREKYPQKSVLVLESGFLPSGASTKNAGFACVGSLSEIVADMRTHSSEEIRQLASMRNEGLKILRSRLGEGQIDYHHTGSHELLFHHEKHLLGHIDEVNKLLEPIFEQPVFSDNTQQINKFGFSSEVKFLIENKAEGALHTGKMMKALIQKAVETGVEYKTLSRVSKIEEEGKTGVRIRIENFDHSIRAEKCFICTNAFALQFMPESDISPGRGQVLITEPVFDLPWKGIYHFDEGYYYFREVNGRILLGGGRNLDFDAETTSEFELNSRIQQDLEAKLYELIFPKRKLNVDMRWSGIMAFGKTKMPIIKQISENVVAGVRLGGMGVAIGSLLGKRLSEFA